jgi:endonuclease/exonuclease/phosphatase (EEP) superfamily protein YafD
MNLTRLPLIARTCGLLMVGALAGTAALAPAPAPSPAVVAAAATPAPQGLQIATYNIKGALSTTQTVTDLRKLSAAGADVMALQEMGSRPRRDAVAAALVNCAGCQYDAFMPTVSGQSEVPILYRWSKFRLEESGATQVSVPTYVGAPGAGPSTMNAKYVTWVKLRQRATGQLFYVLNNHTVPTVQAPTGGSNPAFPVRLSLYRQHMTGLKALVTQVKATGAAVFVTGDLNVSYRRDKVVQDRIFPYYNLRQVGVRASYDALGEPVLGTHVLDNGNATRVIDYVDYLVHPKVTPVKQSVLLGYASDHRPVMVRFDIVNSL